MSKEAYYFSHDSNARNDPKILALRSEYGVQGYGIYWVLVEMLREANDYKLPTKAYIWNAIAMQVQSKDFTKEHAKQFVDYCINECDLFESDDKYFWSNSLINRMDKKNELSKKRSEAAKKRWQKDDNSAVYDENSNANAMQNDANAKQKVNLQSIKGKESKEKESKENKIKKDIKSTNVDYEAQFNEFWNLYGKKVGKKKCEDKFKKVLKDVSFDELMEGVKRYNADLKARNSEQFKKDPLTFLNGAHWEDEYQSGPKVNYGTHNKQNGGNGNDEEPKNKYAGIF
jgi:hypothetical protein